MPGLLRAHTQELHLKASVRCAVMDLLLCTGMYCSPACFGSPQLGGKARLAGALSSKQCIAWPRPTHRSMFQQTSVDAHAHAHSCTVNTALSCPQAQHSAALIEFQTQSMLQGNCIVNQCLSKPRQWSGLHSPFLQIGYEGYTVV